MQDIIKESGLQKYIKHHGPTTNIGSDVYAALDDRVKELVDKAQERAEANDRRTLKPRDL